MCYLLLVHGQKINNQVCRLNGVLVANTKTKRKTNQEKALKTSKMKTAKNSFFHSPKKSILSKNQIAGSKNMTCSLITDMHTPEQSDYRGKPFQGCRSSLPSAHHLRAVQKKRQQQKSLQFHSYPTDMDSLIRYATPQSYTKLQHVQVQLFPLHFFIRTCKPFLLYNI